MTNAVTPMQVFYHLGELDSALSYALGAGSHFNLDEQSEYVQTLIGAALWQPKAYCLHTQQCGISSSSHILGLAVHGAPRVGAAKAPRSWQPP